MRVICISGKAQHGKDTVAGFLKTLEEGNGRRVLIIHYADYLKHICKSYFGWNGEKDETGRTLLQFVGTDVVRKKNPDFWVDTLIGLLYVFDGQWDTVIIPDCRFQNEVFNLMRAGFKVTHVRVARPGFDSGLTGEQAAHPSETEMDAVVPDGYIINSGDLLDLAEMVQKWYYDTFYQQESIL